VNRAADYAADPAISTYIEKTLAARMDAVFACPVLLDIYRTFGGAVFRRSSVFHGLPQFLDQQRIVGRTCLEIGSWNGLSAAVLARHFARVISIDVVDNPVKHDIARRFGLKIEFNVLRADIQATAIAQLDFDFAYLDGDHAHRTPEDFAAVRRCGRVLFHEYWRAQPPVFDLVNSLGPVVAGGTCFALWKNGHA
jgi:SAM-dependent methyltransferase